MNVAVIGGGAAGLMTAAALHESDPSVEIFLLERNDGLGKKVIISGGGRCNVTTGIREVRDVLTRYPRGGKFLSSAMYAFPPEAVYAWFESHGVPLKTEEDLRVFPQSDNGKDVVRVFEKLFSHGHVNVWLKCSVERITKCDQQFLISIKGKDEPLAVDAVVLTTGGQAYRHTGSTGDGYAFAQALGHSLTPLAPSLSSFTTREKWVADVSGVSFERATLSSGKHSYTGPFLFTHKGISGPAVFALSSLVAFEVFSADKPLDVQIDLFPDRNTEELRTQLEAELRANPKKQFANVLHVLLPKSLADIAARELGVSDKRAAELSKADMLRVVHWLKCIPLHATGRGAGDEFVTAGGVELSEVDPRTMESLKCPGLYFGGEILNIDGYTGGFNLQASWATGHLAGTSIAAKITS